MEIKKTHIFIKFNPYTGMGGSKFITTKVHECRIYSGNLASSDTHLYFKEKSGLKQDIELITQAELAKLQSETEEALKHLNEE